MPPEMMLPLAGTLEVRVIASRGLSIHGDVYYELTVATPEQMGQGRAMQIRVPEHALPGRQPPPEGSLARLTFLMQQVTGVAVIDGAAGGA